MRARFNCRFCGCNSIQVLNEKTTPWVVGLTPGYQVECTNCGARGPSGYIDQKNAILAWEEGDNRIGDNIVKLQIVKKEES